jgi:hypothetical protein
MRLLQLATEPGQILDLHPNVTVATGLDDAARRTLTDTVNGLARGRTSGAAGLLEAHGVMFELADEALALLDIVADDLHPVVLASDLPTRRVGANDRGRAGNPQTLARLEEQLTAANETRDARHRARDAAAAALERAVRDANEAEAGASDRIRLIDELTSALDQAQERRRRLEEDRARLEPERDAAIARRTEIETSTADVRGRHQEAALRCSELAGRLDQARLGLDPDAVATWEAAWEQLAKVEAEVAAERAAVADLLDAGSGDGPPGQRLARAQERIEELEKRLAAFGPTETAHVLNALDQLRALHEDELVPSAEAQVLAEQIAELDADLAATAGIAATSPDDLSAARVRLDEARHALLEAEQAVRGPALDRGLVDRLENVHAELVEALDKAGGRFGAARAQRRVESARAEEQAILDELGYGSYSDYMMGYTLLQVDPDKEAALEAARVELSSAEDSWRRLQAEAEAVLARAERMERRRRLRDEARVLLGRAVPAGEVVSELRAHRVPAVVPPEVVDALQRSLEDAGLALSDEVLEREELIVLAEAWLEEASEAVEREQDLRRELVELVGERDLAAAALEAAERAAAGEDPAVDEEREGRLRAARGALDAAEARRRAHVEAEAAVSALSDELASASEAERRAAAEAAEAEDAVARAVNEADRRISDLERIAVELEELDRTEADSREHLESLTELEAMSPEQLAREVAEAEAALAVAEEELRAATDAADELFAEHRAAQARLTLVTEDDGGGVEEGSVADEVEWYLLARLAAQRAVSLGGSLPIVLDDALTGLGEEELGHVLGRLERMADAVQVIVVTDDPLAASWAQQAGEDRAAVVRPEPA